MRKLTGVLVAVALLAGGVTAAGADVACPGVLPGLPPGVSALRHLPADEPTVGVAVHTGLPGTALAARFETLGLVAQPLEHLPLTLLLGTPAALGRAAGLSGVADVYPNRPLELHSRQSTETIHADRVWEDLGVTGAGVGIAVVDTGLDATHAAFEGRVARNVKIVGPQYLSGLGLPVADDTPPGTIGLAVDEGPYSNTDLVGHGTHVAGIAAAGDVGGDAQDSPVGVAPGAHLLGYAIGERYLFTALAAFDDILDHQDAHNIRVVNNSWGDRFEVFDPGDPINVATRALRDAGIVVTFAAGNETEEMTLNAYGVAPWVVSVGSTSLAGASAPTSSGGLVYDGAGVPEDGFPGHARFDGDGLGLYHPHLSAPGETILSTATPTGLVAPPGPHLPDGTAEASGTSMAAPHVAGLAALLLEARPDLTPDQVKRVLQASARPAPGWKVWKSGFGLVDAVAAVTLVTDPDFSDEVLDPLHAARVEHLLARRDRPVVATDLWSFDAAAPVGALGSDRRCLTFAVEPGVDVVRATVSFAGTEEGVRNTFEWAATISDAAGRELGRSAVHARNGVSTLEVDLGALEPAPAFGTWTAQIVAERTLSGPPPVYTPSVSVVVTQLGPSKPAPPGPDAALELPLAPPAAAGVPVPSPEGCPLDQPSAAGALGQAPTGCHAALVGFARTELAGRTEFVSEPFAQPHALGGPGSLVLHLADEASAVWSGQLGARVFYTVELVPPDGGPELLLASEQATAVIAPAPQRGEYAFLVPSTPAPAGSRIRLRFEVTGAHASAARLLYGGEYDSGLLLPLDTAGP